MFCEDKFDIVILGKAPAKNKRLANMVFKCFLDPLGKDIEDYVGLEYADKRGEVNLKLDLKNTTVRSMSSYFACLEQSCF